MSSGKSATYKKYNSQPFKLIGFPLYTVLFFTFYWFVLCPLIFAGLYLNFLRGLYPWTPHWIAFFWIAAILVFIAILTCLFCVWFCARPGPKKADAAVEYQVVELAEQEEFLEKQDKRKPSVLQIEEGFEDIELVDQNVTTPLTPRELFFIDLIEAATNDSTSSGIFSGYTGCTESPRSPSEFFIANVREEKTSTSQVFLYVDPDHRGGFEGEQKVVII